MENKSVDVIIPVYHPPKGWERLLEGLRKQSTPVGKIILMNTGEAPWKEKIEAAYPGTEVHLLEKKDFDHGGTRHLGSTYSQADYLLFLTQDAQIVDEYLVEAFLETFEKHPMVKAAYGRQLPFEDCREIERYTRQFNYPEESRIKSAKDLKTLGIKTFFCSNVCAMYERDTYVKMGGFTRKTIFNEDMIYAGGLIQKGYEIAYVANAQVKHSHNYNTREQFHRNFDLAVSQADHPEIFSGIRSEKEGIRLVWNTMKYLAKKGKLWMWVPLVTTSTGKILGYKMGQNYKKLSKKTILRCTMNPGYWKDHF